MFYRAAQRGGVQSHSQVVSPTFSSAKVKVNVHVITISELKVAHDFNHSNHLKVITFNTADFNISTFH